MGLDPVEIVLRTEEVFTISISDSQAGSVQTIRDFYILICDKLGLIALPSPVTSAALLKITQKDRQFGFVYKHTALPPSPEALPWTPQTVWDTVVAIFVDQMSLAPGDITPGARMNRDFQID